MPSLHHFKPGAAKNLLIAVLLAAGALSQIGCRACCSPYDYTGPVVGCDCEENDWHGRKGSIATYLADGATAEASEPAVLAEAPTPTETEHR